MWRPGDLVKQRPSIFRVDEVGGKVMIVIDIIHPGVSNRPPEVITQCNGKLYHWNEDALISATGPSGTWSSWTTTGGSSWD